MLYPKLLGVPLNRNTLKLSFLTSKGVILGLSLGVKKGVMEPELLSDLGVHILMLWQDLGFKSSILDALMVFYVDNVFIIMSLLTIDAFCT